jgi:hypothetical protein
MIVEGYSRQSLVLVCFDALRVGKMTPPHKK